MTRIIFVWWLLGGPALGWAQVAVDPSRAANFTPIQQAPAAGGSFFAPALALPPGAPAPTVVVPGAITPMPVSGTVPAPNPNISSQVSSPLQQFLSSLGSGGGGGENGRPKHSRADGTYDDPEEYSGPDRGITAKDSYSRDAAARLYPDGDVIPSCKQQPISQMAQLPSNSGANLAGHHCTSADKDPTTCMVCNLYYEAAGEPDEGQLNVSRSVMSRVFSGAYPDTICKVVYQADGKTAQYSWTYEHKNSHVLPSGAGLDRVIRNALAGMKQGPNCYTNYYNPNGADPKWAHGGTCAATLKTVYHHRFCEINGASTRTVSQIRAAELKEMGTNGGASGNGEGDATR